MSEPSVSVELPGDLRKPLEADCLIRNITLETRIVEIVAENYYNADDLTVGLTEPFVKDVTILCDRLGEDFRTFVRTSVEKHVQAIQRLAWAVTENIQAKNY